MWYTAAAMRRMVVLGVVLLGGCSMTEFAANGVVRVTGRASPAVNEQWDYEFAREAVPGGITRLEGMFEVVPDNEDLLLQLVRGYAAYGFAFVEDEMEEAELQNDWDAADRLRRRAQLSYARAIMFAKRLFRLREEGFDDAFAAGPEEFAAWVNETFDDPEDVPMLFWSGYAWGLSVRAGDPSALVDLPYARALVERSVALDETYFHYAGVTFMAAIESSIPESVGGNPERGRELFERALELTERKALTVQLNYARTWAVNNNDRELYESLLREVLEAGDTLPDARLANKIARRRAERSLRRTDELFY